jgi:hypothetical protein
MLVGEYEVSILLLLFVIVFKGARLRSPSAEYLVEIGDPVIIIL